MNFGRNYLIVKVILGFAIIIFLSVNGFSRYATNGTEKGFIEEEGQTLVKSGTESIESYIVKGAGFLLDGRSGIIKFIDDAENTQLTGSEMTALRNDLLSVIENMNNARTTYYNLIKKAEITPYDTSMISKLSSFKYLEFKNANNLNPEVFGQVEKSLGKGDIRGTYKEMYLKINETLGILLTIDSSLETGSFPDAGMLLELSSISSDLELYGQYVSRIFYSILGWNY